ncbi:hypothetical protein JG687_00018906 [Phytophthora cactorum]|uniref:Uncharacterized protein n=1 Tax=Phytophthora cactorum TaxID=29920 RepID=A0A329SSH2_9STRA|nr:hypothetical protein JG687_00018906 [Phytophthora cactorum]RAW39854.1 hypothetical protein PC110_g3936 [Phytophthora cactorum]
MELSKDALQTGPYQISLVSRDEYIDSFYYPKGKLVWKECLVVFHTKEVSRHPVCGQGIETVLEKLELLKKALKKPKSVRQILVGLKLDKNKLERKQTIRWDVLSNFEIVEIISDIGPAETNQLKAINVKTVRDLRTAVDAPSTQQRTFFSPGVSTQYCTILKRFDERQNSIEAMPTKIPQYVLEV